MCSKNKTTTTTNKKTETKKVDQYWFTITRAIKIHFVNWKQVKLNQDGLNISLLFQTKPLEMRGKTTSI